MCCHFRVVPLSSPPAPLNCLQESWSLACKPSPNPGLNINFGLSGHWEITGIWDPTSLTRERTPELEGKVLITGPPGNPYNSALKPPKGWLEWEKVSILSLCFI
ncbi:unnamed protein product [Rangifer tarandus platyrhynchus]|uniref:Uncharacterized protein n=1 Tax=Rangifer tarandus platyrhynchus TaxID=3082113 RepID=A0AC59ZTH4_RANTA